MIVISKPLGRAVRLASLALGVVVAGLCITCPTATSAEQVQADFSTIEITCVAGDRQRELLLLIHRSLVVPESKDMFVGTIEFATSQIKSGRCAASNLHDTYPDAQMQARIVSQDVHVIALIPGYVTGEANVGKGGTGEHWFLGIRDKKSSLKINDQPVVELDEPPVMDFVWTDRIMLTAAPAAFVFPDRSIECRHSQTEYPDDLLMGRIENTCALLAEANGIAPSISVPVIDLYHYCWADTPDLLEGGKLSWHEATRQILSVQLVRRIGQILDHP